MLSLLIRLVPLEDTLLKIILLKVKVIKKEFFHLVLEKLKEKDHHFLKKKLINKYASIYYLLIIHWKILNTYCIFICYEKFVLKLF